MKKKELLDRCARSGGGRILLGRGLDKLELARKEELQYAFREFAPCLGKCQFQDCAHVKEKGCAVLAAVEAGEVAQSRHQNYRAIYQELLSVKDWELNKP